MPCFHPLSAFYSSERTATGKNAITFDPGRSVFGPQRGGFQLPCGRCIGCRLEYSRQWAVRCMHEAQQHERNSFLTLTYSDNFLPVSGSLCVRDFQLFMKRLRKKCGSVRFFHCGEYGLTYDRPHYHAALFGLDFSDKVLFKRRNEVCLYTSETLSSLWTAGFSTVGELTFESAAYVARYVVKKFSGSVDDKLAHYQGRRPEYVTMSRRPGIGRGFYDRFKSDIYPSDFLVFNGVKMKPPRFYDTAFEHDNAEVFRRLKGRRVLRAQRENIQLNSTHERLLVRERIQEARANLLPRDGDF